MLLGERREESWHLNKMIVGGKNTNRDIVLPIFVPEPAVWVTMITPTSVDCFLVDCAILHALTRVILTANL